MTDLLRDTGGPRACGDRFARPSLVRYRLGSTSGLMAEMQGRSESGAPRIPPAGESLSKLAVEWLPNGVLILRPDGTITVVNREVEHRFGYAGEELVGKPADALVPGLLTDTVPLAVPATLDLLGRHRTGSTFPVRITVNAVQTEEGRFLLAALISGS